MFDDDDPLAVDTRAAAGAASLSALPAALPDEQRDAVRVRGAKTVTVRPRNNF